MASQGSESWKQTQGQEKKWLHGYVSKLKRSEGQSAGFGPGFHLPPAPPAPCLVRSAPSFLIIRGRDIGRTRVPFWNSCFLTSQPNSFKPHEGPFFAIRAPKHPRSFDHGTGCPLWGANGQRPRVEHGRRSRTALDQTNPPATSPSATPPPLSLR